MHHSPELKIKLLTLGFEIRTIRRIEQKMVRAARAKESLLSLRDKAHGLHLHRKSLSIPARNTLLAYGFLKDRPYKVMEQKRYTDPNWNEIQRMATTYGSMNGADPRDIAQRFEQWKQAAGEKDART